jgi:hypothetical protein
MEKFRQSPPGAPRNGLCTNWPERGDRFFGSPRLFTSMIVAVSGQNPSSGLVRLVGFSPSLFLCDCPMELTTPEMETWNYASNTPYRWGLACILPSPFSF